MFLLDQQADLRTTFNDGFCALLTQVVDNSQVLVSGFGIDLPEAQLFIDYLVNDVPISFGWNHYLQSVLLQATFVKVLLHGELRAKQTYGCEAFILDDEMHSVIYRALRGIEVSPENLGFEAICEAVLGDGHFLGGSHTFEAMERDYFYPVLADRDPPVTWAEKGAPDAWGRAKETARSVLATHHPRYLDDAQDLAIRKSFKILD